MIYKENYCPFTREELLERIRVQMSDKRFNHVLRVEKAAITLAQENGVNEEKTSVAALVHDYAKERPDSDFINEIKLKKYPTDLLKYGNEIWHGLVGADFVKIELGISDEDILNAVRHHTTGAGKMSKLEQIIYVADYIEEGRTFPGVDEARKLANEDLKLAVAYETKQTLSYLINQEVLIYPKTLETYNAWVAN